MQVPALQDTIVAVSTGWQPAALAIVRLSGPRSFELVAELSTAPPARSGVTGRCTSEHLRLAEFELPATAYWFREPHSYTGQDLVELHTVGTLPWLRVLAAWFLEHGARRALPGEFTARAYLAHRLSADQVEGVLALMETEHAVGLRQAARLAHGGSQAARDRSVIRLTDLLARIEAGIDFVEEEAVQFITPGEVARELNEILRALRAESPTSDSEVRSGRPHVALVGLPNAGKSTLFNALLGYERALVSPVLGTTRDVLSAELLLDGRRVVLQDCAGLGGSAAELDLATYVATERAAEHADVVVWVHAADAPWDAGEDEVCARLISRRCILAWTKSDLHSADASAPPDRPGRATAPTASARFSDRIEVSVVQNTGLDQLRAAMARLLAELASLPDDTHRSGAEHAAGDALVRALEVVSRSGTALREAELVALEVRTALETLIPTVASPLDEVVLGRIFGQFCVGK